ncbi:MAG: hypothetical protein IKF54_05215 [Eubacterium sp.]|nr:hypothetical protein [Eubacterium sp.]
MARKTRYLLMISAAVMIVLISSSSVFAATSVVNSKKYTHPAFYKTSLYRLFHGVDVSYWQGAINWTKSKAAGIDFAILRCGYTALNSFSLHQDSTFITNYKAAKKAGVSTGVYYYACATTSSEAKKEANYVISILQNNKIKNQLPVVMDYEIDSGRANTVYKSLVKKKGKAYARRRYTKNAVTFMNTLRASGYETMFYSYRMMVDPKVSANYRFNMEDINGGNKFRFWLAQYSTSNSYAESMELWQFSSTGRVSGMKGNIDRNFWYYPLSGVKTTSGTKSIRKCTVTLSDSAFKYDGEIKEPEVTVTSGDTKLKKNKDYAVSYMDNIKKGTATVLVHGKGDYSNETYSTFKIGDKNVSSNKTSTAETATPSKIGGLSTTLDVDGKTVTVKWAKDDSATLYRVGYKINDADKWTYIESKKRTLTIEKVKKNKIIEIKVRGENVTKKKTYKGSWSDHVYRYMRDEKPVCEVIPGNKIKVNWAEHTDKKGEGKYKVTLDCVDISKKTYNTKKYQKTLKGKHRYCYDVYVTPSLVRDGHEYIGARGEKAHAYVIYGKISKISSIRGGFRVWYPETTGIGDPRYKISYSLSKDMSKAKHFTKPQKVTKCSINKLKSGKKYYVTVQTYKDLHGARYYGVASEPSAVTAG